MSQDFHVFVVAPTGRDAPLICEMLGRRGISCESCDSVQALCHRMSTGAGAVILTEEALVADAMEHLDSLFSTQPKWSDLGFVLLTSDGDRIHRALGEDFRRVGARSVVVIERPVRLFTLISAVESALQSRRRQYEIRDYLRERARNEERLRQTQKLESIGVLAGGIAHDFNNLLTGVMGNASLALETVPKGSKAIPMLRDVVNAAERAAHLTRQLLAYAGKGRFVVRPLDLSQQVREISQLLQTSIPRTVQLRLELGENLPSVEADAAQFQQVIMNLVINGAEAIPEGEAGFVLITTGVQDVDGAFIRTIASGADIAPGRYVTVEVRDTGVGMDEATMARIFDPFFTTKFTGRGLGLAAVLGIVRGHKAALKIESRLGQGTTFRLFFPASRQEGPSSSHEAQDQRSAGAGKVLVIDDEEIVRHTARVALQRHGFEVLVAPDGRAGLEVFRNLPDRDIIVLLDMTMPVMSGEETFRELRMIQPDVRIILSSGYNEAEAVRRFPGKCLTGFIQKPYTAERLASAVRAALKQP